MSKMVKLLKKAENFKHDSFSSNIKSDETAKNFNEAPPGAIPDVMKQSFEQNVDGDQYSLNGQEEIPYSGHRISLALMTLVVMVALASLFVSSQALRELRKSRAAALMMMEKINSQKNTLKGLALSVKEIKGTDLVKIESIHKQLSHLTENQSMKDNELVNLIIDQNIMEVVVQDLKITDRLLLNKFITLNENVQEISRKQEEIKKFN